MNDVLIVGAGPVGLTMALACQQQGMAFRLIEKLPEPSGLSKALAVWSAALEMLDGLGVAGGFLGRGIVAKGVKISRGRQCLIEIPAGLGVDSPFPQMVLLPQSESEQILWEALEAGGGKIERGAELAGLVPSENGVAVKIRHPDGQVEDREFRWVVACDGAHSTVRHLIGAQFEGDAMEDPFVLCDAWIEGEIEPARAQIFWSSKGLLAVFPVLRGVWRVIGTRSDRDADTEPTLEEMQAILDERGPGGWTLHDPTWLSLFRISERMATSFRHGRVLLAGDAAHIHSPAGGQGMNTGMQDAFNLAWKLSVLASGYGDEDAVLDSYHSERAPVAARVLAESGRMIRSNYIKNPIAQIVRDNVVRMASHSAKIKKTMALKLSGLDLHYPTGTFVADDQAWEEDWRPYGFAPGWRPRDVSVYRSREPISLFTTWHPPLFTLLMFSGRRPIYRDMDRLSAVELVAEGWGKLVRTVRVWCGDEPPPGDWLLDPDGSAHRKFGVELPAFYLIRPDQYVALRSQPAEAGVLQDWLARSLPGEGNPEGC